MLHSRSSRRAFALPILTLTGLAGGQIVPAQDAGDADHADAHQTGRHATRLVIPLPSQTATVPALGQSFEMPCEEVWKPICSNQAELTEDDLAQMAATHAAHFQNSDGAIIIDSDDGFTPRAGLNLVYSLDGS